MLAIRQSLLASYKTCPYSCLLDWGELGVEGEAERRYAEHDESDSNKYALCGIALHEVMEEWGNDKKSHNVKDTLYYHKLLGVKIDAIDLSFFDDEDDKEDRRLSLAEQLDWLFEQADSNEILFNEYRFGYEDLISEITIPITGTIDRIDGDIKAKRATLIDYKTGRPYTKKSLKVNQQAFIYSIAFYKDFGFLPEKFVFYFSKAKKKMIVWITPEFLQDAGAELLSTWFKIEKGEFPCNDKNKFFCKNFCNHYKVCPKGAKKKSTWDSLATS